jgi:ABC-2 type transport system permease protein
VTGAVYDRGYRPYDGERGGRAAARAALFRATVRRALGLRRPWRQKVAPFVLLAIAVIPAIVNVGVKYLTRNSPARDIDFFTYREYVGVSNALLVFVGLTAPDIMCPDRRQRVLPLIFARPLTGRDYVAAKVGAMAAILFAFSFIPQLILFVGQMLVSDDGALRYLRDNAEVIWQVPAAVALLALYYASVGVALASLTSRRIIAGATFVGVLLVSSIVSTILVGEGTDRAPDGSLAALINLASLPLVLRDLIFLGHVDEGQALSGVTNGGPYAIGVFTAIALVALVTLIVRYDEVER